MLQALKSGSFALEIHLLLGMGLTRSYLWYKRDGSKLAHDAHIFAFITVGFWRMQSDNFSGYGKPVLKLQSGVLAITNVPAPKRSFFTPWLLQSMTSLNKLKSIELLRKIYKKITSQKKPGFTSHDSQTQEVVTKIFEALHQINEAKNSALVLVYLPMRADYTGKFSESWREYIGSEARKRGLLLIDLVNEF